MKKLAPLYLMLFFLLLGMACRKETQSHFQISGVDYELDYPTEFRPEKRHQKIMRCESILQNVALFRDRSPRISLDQLFQGSDAGHFIAQGRFFEISPILKKAFFEHEFSVIQAALGNEVNQRFINGQLFYLLQPKPDLMVALTPYDKVIYAFYYAQEGQQGLDKTFQTSLNSIHFHSAGTSQLPPEALLVSSHSPTKPLFSQVRIKGIQLLQLPIKRRDGKTWDHLAPTPFNHPDVYCDILRDGDLLVSNREAQWSNLSLREDLPQGLALRGPATSTTQELQIRVYDDDWEVDGGAKLMLEFNFAPSKVKPGQKHYYRADPAGQWQIELDLEWE